MVNSQKARTTIASSANAPEREFQLLALPVVNKSPDDIFSQTSPLFIIFHFFIFVSLQSVDLPVPYTKILCFSYFIIILFVPSETLFFLLSLCIAIM